MTELLQIANMGSICSFFSEAGQNYPLLNSFFLLFSIVVPLAVAISLAISGKLTDRAVKIASLFGFLVPALISLWLTVVYLSAFPDGGYAFVINAPLGLERFGISLFLGLNGISVPFYLLAGIVGLASGLYAMQRNYERLRLFVILLLIMQAGLLGVFSSIDILFFYFFHEFALIPTFVMNAIMLNAVAPLR